jgi:hypothetical protein
MSREAFEIGFIISEGYGVVVGGLFLVQVPRLFEGQPNSAARRQYFDIRHNNTLYTILYNYAGMQSQDEISPVRAVVSSLFGIFSFSFSKTV